MEKFYIITNELKDPDYSFSAEVIRFVTDHGKECTSVRTEEEYQHLRENIDPKNSCIIVVGGDGSILRANRRVLGCGAPILGINLGTLGYLSEVERGNWKEMLMRLFAGNYELEERMMLEGRLVQKDGTLVEDSPVFYALNDVVIARKNIIRVINFDVYVDGYFLNNYNGDGIIFSTATGSTAYNLSAGGPIVEPKARLIMLTPICSHAINNRSIVLSKSDNIIVEMKRTDRNETMEAEAVFDGDCGISLRCGDRIAIQRSEKTATLVKLSKRSFLTTLHNKILS